MASSQQTGPTLTAGPGIWPPARISGRPPSGYQRGAAFARAMFLQQRDAGLPAAQIMARTWAAIACLRLATREDSDREFLRGYADSSATHLATLHGVQPTAGQAVRCCQEVGQL